MTDKSDRQDGDGATVAREIVTEWLGMFDPPPQIDFQQSEFLQGAIASALAIPRTGKSPAVAAESVALASHNEIGRKVSNQPWDIQKAIITIAAHCTVLTDEHPTGIVADLAGCISQGCLELATALASPPVRRDREAVMTLIEKHVGATMDLTEGEGALIGVGQAADAILSLPVQPIAPRLPQDTLDRLAMLNVSEEEVYEVLKKHIPKDMIDGIWQEIKEAGRSGAGERELSPAQLSIINDMTNAWLDEPQRYRMAFRNDCKRLLALSRQAPHSSSETER